jgi:hypothetical protein
MKYLKYFALLLIANSIYAQNNYNLDKRYNSTDLKDLIKEVLSKSEGDLDHLRHYVFKEREVCIQKIDGETQGYRRDYVWIINKNGYLVRSPILINGIAVSSKEQATAEEEWLKEQQNQKGQKSSLDFFLDCMRNFISKSIVNRITGGKKNAGWDDFFSFKIMPDKFKYAGEQLYEGQNVIKVKFNESVLNSQYAGVQHAVTMLIEPRMQQLINITINRSNYAKEMIGQEDEISMNMHKILEDIWLPLSFSYYMKVDTNYQHISLSYKREFYSYAKTDVKVNLWFDDVK